MIFIRPTELSDIQSLVKIAELQYGYAKGYGSRILTKNIRFTALVDGIIAGFATASILSQYVGCLNDCVVHPNFSGRGVASLLVSARIKEIQRFGVPQVVAFAWWKTGTARPNMAGILEKKGFCKKKIIRNRYRGHRDCPVCKPTCGCLSVLYKKCLLQ